MVCLTTYDSSETRSLRTWLHALDSRGGVGVGGCGYGFESRVGTRWPCALERGSCGERGLSMHSCCEGEIMCGDARCSRTRAGRSDPQHPPALRNMELSGAGQKDIRPAACFFSPPFSLSPFSDPLFNFCFNPTLCSSVPCCLREKSVFTLISSSRPTAHEWLFHLALLASGF